MSITYINHGKVVCMENGKEYENVKMMDIGEDQGSLFWNEELQRWCRWKTSDEN